GKAVIPQEEGHPESDRAVFFPATETVQLIHSTCVHGRLTRDRKSCCRIADGEAPGAVDDGIRHRGMVMHLGMSGEHGMRQSVRRGCLAWWSGHGYHSQDPNQQRRSNDAHYDIAPFC